MAGENDGRSLLLRRPLLVGFVVVLLLSLLREWPAIREVLLLAFLAVLLAAVLTWPIDWLARRTGRVAATLLTLAAVAGLIALFALVWAPAATRQARQLGQTLLDGSSRLDEALRHLARGGQGAEPSGPAAASAVREGLHGMVASLLPRALPAVATVAELLYTTILTLALAFFLAAAPDRYRTWIRSYIPPSSEEVWDTAWLRVGGALRHWMGGIIVSMTLMGTLAAIGLHAIGLAGWLPLSILVFVGTFVPYVGALISTIPGLAVALSDSPARFGWALIVYASVHLVEGMLVEPLIMRRAVKLRPAALLLWQMLMGATFGLPGVIVATPLLACVQEALDLLWVERRLGKAPVDD